MKKENEKCCKTAQPKCECVRSISKQETNKKQHEKIKLRRILVGIHIQGLTSDLVGSAEGLCKSASDTLGLSRPPGTA